MKKQLKIATMKDYDRIQQFLQKAEISTIGVAENIHHFVVIENDEKEVMATVGFEKEGTAGILRSLVVSPALMKSDILMLFESVVQLAKEHGVYELYLVTNKASSVQFFEMMNFQQINHQDLPLGLKQRSYLQQLPDLNQVYVMAYEAM
ncbi:acetyltransferase [Priestia megaterium]|nr:acetyltransferase [Priestia megaterium]